MPTRDIEEEPDGIVVTYQFNNIIFHNDDLYQGTSTALIEGFSPNSEPGEPATLFRWDTFVVPNRNVQVETVDSSYVEFPLELAPARPLLSNSGNETYTKENVLPVSPYYGLFPSSAIPSTRNDSYRRQPLLEVCVCPLQYDLENKKVRVFTKIKYKVKFDTSELDRTSVASGGLSKAGHNTFLRNIALNVRDDLRDTPNYPRQLADSRYLIVSVPKYASAVNRLAEWKRTLGHHVKVSIKQTWTSDEIIDTVRNAFSPELADYLLLFGGHSDVPSERIDPLSANYLTDLYYACMEEGSFTPDIYRGRIPVTNLDEANVVVDKIIGYEKTPATDTCFYNTGIHCAYFQDDSLDSYEDRRFVMDSEIVRNRMLRLSKTVYRIYEATEGAHPAHWSSDYIIGPPFPSDLLNDYAWNGDSTEITNRINQHAFYILQRDHGSAYTWGHPKYNVGNINSLNNGKHLPVVFSISCSTGNFLNSDCFGAEFLKKSDGGCVGIFCATDESVSKSNDVLSLGMFDAIWPDSTLLPHFVNSNPTYSPSPVPTYCLGQILDQGLRRVRETNSIWSSRKTHQLYHCFGDPGMMITTDVPTEFTGASIVRQNGIITVHTGGDIAKISFYNRRTGLIETFEGITYTYTDDPETSVCISGHNRIPYIDSGTLYIQNQTLAEGGYYEADKIKVGNSVTSTRSPGDVNLIQGSYILTGSEVELHPGTTVSSGVQLDIKNR